jgi:hypothetical protein
MSDMTVVIWTEEAVGNKQGWLQAAGDAVRTLEGQLDVEIDTWMPSNDPDLWSPVVPDVAEPDSWNWILKNFGEHVVDNWDVEDTEYHMILIDELGIDPGAGYTKGDVNDFPNPFQKWNYLRNCKAAIGGVNVAVKAYENRFKPYGGHGSKAFKATVIHEILHSLSGGIKNDPADRPAAPCGGSQGDKDHSLGSIYTWDDPQSVSPFLLWYTGGDWFSGNGSPCTTCRDHPNANTGNISFELSRCTKDYVNTHLSKKNSL